MELFNCGLTVIPFKLKITFLFHLHWFHWSRCVILNAYGTLPFGILHLQLICDYLNQMYHIPAHINNMWGLRDFAYQPHLSPLSMPSQRIQAFIFPLLSTAHASRFPRTLPGASIERNVVSLHVVYAWWSHRHSVHVIRPANPGSLLCREPGLLNMPRCGDLRKWHLLPGHASPEGWAAATIRSSGWPFHYSAALPATFGHTPMLISTVRTHFCPQLTS